MSSGYFSVGIYGQSGLVMDWFGLNDPFTQQLPVKITNNWSGTIWVQGELINPPTGVYSSYSGVSMSGVNAGASATAVMTWNVNVSGQTATSSPVTHALTLGLLAFTSSNYTGALASGNFAFNNTLFSRWSGVIKVFGDQYSNDQPILSVVQGGAGTLSLSGYSYAVSYVLSGWESDIGAPTFLASNSGASAVNWSSVAGVTQYLLWRFSGSVDFTLHSGTSPPNGGLLRPMDLIYASNQLSFTDSGVAALQSNLFRHRNFQRYSASGTADGALPTSDTTTYLSPPASRALPSLPASAAFRFSHGYHLSKNVSGTNLLGPFYGVFHLRLPAQNTTMIFLDSNVDGSVSGISIADTIALTNQLPNVWYRDAILLGASGNLSASGTIHLQIGSPGEPNPKNVDDIFIVAQS